MNYVFSVRLALLKIDKLRRDRVFLTFKVPIP